MRPTCLAALIGLAVSSVACEDPDTDMLVQDAAQQPASAAPLEAGLALDAAATHDAAVVDARVEPVPDASAPALTPRADAAASGDASARDANAASTVDAVTPSATDAGMPSAASPCPEQGPCVILPLGDSITYGLGVSDNASYRVELFRRAAADQHEISFVGSLQSGPSSVDGKPFPRKNEGHSGWTISQIAGLVPSPALQGKPDIVLLMAGTNDMYMSASGAPARLGSLLDKLFEADPTMQVVVAQLTPTSSFESAVKTFNSALPVLVRERAMAGKHVALVDLHTGFPSAGLADGVHPNAEGYKWMAGVWYQAIEPWLR